MSRDWARLQRWLLLGTLAGGTVLWLLSVGLELPHARRSSDPGGRALEIRLAGLAPKTLSRLALPLDGWTVELLARDEGALLSDEPPRVVFHQAGSDTLIESHALERVGGGWRIPIGSEATGVVPGRLSIRASAELSDSQPVERSAEVQIRGWAAGPPIGHGQIVYFDFMIDREGDGRPDFPSDLERFGLATSTRPDLARRVADRIASRALERARRAYRSPPSPDRWEHGDPVSIELRIEPAVAGDVTRICVGGADPSGGHTVGNVRFDPANSDRRSVECDTLPPTGLFPRSLTAYHEEEAFRTAFDPLIRERGGLPVGEHPLDEALLTQTLSYAPTRSAEEAEETERRRALIEGAISTLGDVLGTIMAHETGHALGLVAPGPPGTGLFGGRDGTVYAHSRPADSRQGGQTWLMDPGGALSFADLAGRGETGELRFRPLDYAYLRDRIVLSAEAAPPGPPPGARLPATTAE